MASIKDLKKRIGSVKNTQQTTKAMKMVSAAKLRRAQDAILAHRPYARRIGGLIALLSAQAGRESDTPLIRRAEGVETPGKKRALLVLVTSDRGLCAAFNSNVIKAALRWTRENGEAYGSVRLGFVGRKGHDFFKTRDAVLGPYFPEFGGKAAFAKAKKLSDALMESYVRGDVDEVKLVYNEFKNAVTQRVVVEDFLPLPDPATAEAVSPDSSSEGRIYLLKPGRDELLARLLEKNFSIQAYRILLESQASEHGARMSAMENATKNAGEMIRKLTLQYNKQRQAGITKELLEIISGAESQKSTA